MYPLCCAAASRRPRNAPVAPQPGSFVRRRVAARTGQGYHGAMSRIPIATIIALVGFTAYVTLVVTLADRVASLHWSLQALYFLVVGTVWVLPMRSLMYWAARK
jgi:hypothetical protein